MMAHRHLQSMAYPESQNSELGELTADQRNNMFIENRCATSMVAAVMTVVLTGEFW